MREPQRKTVQAKVISYFPLSLRSLNLGALENNLFSGMTDVVAIRADAGTTRTGRSRDYFVLHRLSDTGVPSDKRGTKPDPLGE